MKRAEIENKLNSWFESMMDKYHWLSFKYEFSERLGVFLVGYYPADKVDADNEFCLEAMGFEDEMNNEFGLDAPLFGNEEDCFRFTAEAKVIKRGAWNIPKQNFIVEASSYTFQIASKQSYDAVCVSELELAA